MSFFKKIFWGQKRLSTPISLSVLECDMHSHFIPGIDDGAATLEDSIALVNGMKLLGYKKVITTPHIMSDTYQNSSQTILPGLEKVKSALRRESISIEVAAAAEYYIDAEFEEKIKQKDLLTFGNNYVLFEMPFVGEPVNLSKVIFEMQLGGYIPVMAHVERYPFWHNQYQKIIDLKDKGVLLQVNISSYTGYYSPAVKKMAERLADEKMIDFLGSDCHHLGHLQLLQQACYLPHLKQAVEKNELKNSLL